MELTIEITQADIDQGVRGSVTQCALAIAITRQLNLPKPASTGYQIMFTLNGVEYRGLATREAEAFMYLFDKSRKVGDVMPQSIPITVQPVG